MDGAGVAGAVKEAVSVVAVCDNAARDAATEWSGSVSGTLCALNTTSDLAPTPRTASAFTGSVSAPPPAVSMMMSHAGAYSSEGSLKPTSSSWALK